MSIFTTKNLLVNGGAEAGIAALDFNTTEPLTGWATTGGFTAVSYNTGFGDATLLNPTLAAAYQGGSHFFAGGPPSPASTAVQTIDLTSYAARIDAHQTKFDVSGQFGGYLSQDDFMTLDVTVFAADGVTVLMGLFIDGGNAGTRLGTTSLHSIFTDSILPAGARFMQVTLTAINVSGGYNDAYADNIAVHLRGVASGLLLVAQDHLFVSDTFGPSTGISFQTHASTHATFTSSQFGTTGVSLTGLIEGSVNNDILSILLDGSSTFSAAGFHFSNWTSVSDVIELIAGAGGQKITGSTLSDHITTGAGVDTLAGGAGADILEGGSGIDHLVGGTGADTFILSNTFADRDIIADFLPGTDHIAISVSTFGLGFLPGDALGDGFISNLTGQATTPQSIFIYQQNTGALFYDPDGKPGPDGGAPAVLIATLTGAPFLTAADFLLIE